ncbi:hypothetical protein THIOM_003167 [Candidatus Thiomargarita nelsonii]|uniref:Uncharacterized protein n=1 Tax=Candidatus Thiomargarita nelsonii TaxID=1003181 RepID=A0A176RZH4_9GAMM|nr:hypothetical protein THIOM_003167 [Candidatus Thiomargarita nelsonii]
MTRLIAHHLLNEHFINTDTQVEYPIQTIDFYPFHLRHKTAQFYCAHKLNYSKSLSSSNYSN